MNDRKIKKIQRLVNLLVETNKFQNKDEKALESDLTWGASVFFSKILVNTKPNNSYWSKIELESFTKKYNLKNNTSISLNSLLDRYWIREVLDVIHVPYSIRKIVYDFEKMQNYYHELIFIQALYKIYPTQKVNEETYKSFINKYKSDHRLTLDEIWIESNWIKAKNENDKNLTIGNIYYYFTLLENWEEFKFLYVFIEEKSKIVFKGLAISKKKFNEIHITHKSYFIHTPTIVELRKQEVFNEVESEYYINFYDNKISYWGTLGDKISGLIWEELIINNTISDNKKKLKKFLSIILYWEHYWSEFYNHITKSSQKIFIEAAVELILEEKDINDIKNEFLKCYLDDNLNHTLNLYENSSIDSLKATNDYYELYRNFNFLSDKYQGNIFYTQEVRNHLAFLIKVIIFCDTHFTDIVIDGKTKKTHFPIIKRLLKNGLKKPYLLWETCHFLVQYKPTIIPYFFEEAKLASLGFHLIQTIKTQNDLNHINDLKLTLYENSLRFSLESIFLNLKSSKLEQALTVFQFYNEINNEKYKLLSRAKTLEGQYQEREYCRKKENLLLSVIENHTLRSSSREYLLPKIIMELIGLFKNYETQPLYLNGTIQFSMIILDGLSWLSKCTYHTKYKNQFENVEEIKELISITFKNHYLKKIEQEIVSKKDFRSNKLVDGLPNWGERNERLNQIDWVYPMILMEHNDYLDFFLKPKFFFKKSKHEYNEENRFNAQKTRTHLFVLLSALRKINSNQSNYFNLYNKIVIVRDKLEKQIIVMLNKYAIVGKSSKIDILSASFERQISVGSEEELVPQISQAVNWFKNKNDVIETLINTSDLLRLLIILDWITSEGLRKEIIEKVSDSEIIKYFESQNWLPEIELTLSKLSEYNELINHTEKALDYWEKKIPSTTKKGRYQHAIFVVKLMLAYKNKDILKINNLTPPEQNNFNIRNFKSSHYKQFFIGLVHFENNPEKAYKIFDILYREFRNHTSICINRFASKINWANKVGDDLTKNRLLNEALQEWSTIEEYLPKTSIDSIKDKIWMNKLTVYFHLRDYKEFEKLYLDLPKPYQMIKAIISLKIEMLVVQSKQQEAVYLLSLAKDYHRLSDGSTPNFINKLNSLVDDKSNINILRANYLDIFSRNPKTLIKIFPEKLNGQIEIGNFIAKEFAIAINKALDKILAIEEIKNEDKYNDLVQIALESRFGIFGWTVKDQTRGAFSASSLSLGERDIVIEDSNNETILVCEAFIYRNIKTTQSHLKKVFNYHHKKEYFIILVYDLGTQGRFESKWEKYFNDTLFRLKYPKGFEIDILKNKDLTDEFNYRKSAIKIGITNHGKQTSIYHIMVNLKYNI